MTSRAVACRQATAIIGMVVLAASVLAADRMSLGEAIYRQGLGRDARAVGAAIGEDGSVRMQGTTVACTNCHGADARGGREGWIRSPDVRWHVLAAPQGRPRTDGSTRPPYDPASFARVLRTGATPDGLPLDSVMPRYDLADDEIAALQQFLATLDQAASALAPPPALVVLLPERTSGPAQDLLQAWQSCPAPEGTRLPALTVVRYRQLGDALPVLRGMARNGRLAALFAPFLAGVETQWDAEGLEATPVLLPITLLGLDAARPAAHGHVRFALPSLRQQALALLAGASAVSVARTRRLVVLHDANTPGALLDSLHAQAAGGGWTVSMQDAAAAIPRDSTHVLTLATMPMPGNAAPDGLQWLVPAMHLQPAAAEAWTRRGHAVHIAYPWPPQAPGQARWIGPQQAWHAIGCELLQRLPPLPSSAQDTSVWQRDVMALPSLHLQGWLTLPNAASAASATQSGITIRPWSEASR